MGGLRGLERGEIDQVDVLFLVCNRRSRRSLVMGKWPFRQLPRLFEPPPTCAKDGGVTVRGNERVDFCGVLGQQGPLSMKLHEAEEPIVILKMIIPRGPGSLLHYTHRRTER